MLYSQYGELFGLNGLLECSNDRGNERYICIMQTGKSGHHLNKLGGIGPSRCRTMDYLPPAASPPMDIQTAKITKNGNGCFRRLRKNKQL